MDIILLTAIAFIAGYLTRPRLENWLKWNRPFRCPDCGRWVEISKTIPAQHRTAGTVRICTDCWDRHYQPFEGNEPQDRS